MTNGAKPYRVINVRDTTYLDKAGEAIEGKAVKVEIFEFDEITTFRVPNVKDNIVAEAVLEYIAERGAL